MTSADCGGSAAFPTSGDLWKGLQTPFVAFKCKRNQQENYHFHKYPPSPSVRTLDGERPHAATAATYATAATKYTKFCHKYLAQTAEKTSCLLMARPKYLAFVLFLLIASILETGDQVPEIGCAAL